MSDPNSPAKSHRLPQPDVKATLTLIGCCAIWGVGLVMVKIANTGISPFLHAALRSIVAGAILWTFATWRGVPLWSRDGTLLAGVVCGVLFGLEFLALYLGVAMTNVSRGTIFLHCAPFVAAVGEHYFVPGHKLSRVRLLGLVLAFCGLGIAMADGFGKVGGSFTGDLLCLAGGVFWGLTTVVIRASNLKFAPAEKTLLYQLAVSIPVCLAASLLLGEVGIQTVNAKVLLAFAYTVIFVVVLGYTTWFWLMRSYSAASLHAFTFLTPLFSVMAGRVILGEPTPPGLLFALLLVAGGIYLVNKPETASA